MSMTEQELTARTMKRVKRIHTLRKFINPFAFKVYALGISSVAILSFVSVSQVIKNAAHIATFEQFISFTTSAFLNTETAAQVLSLTILLVVVLALKDIGANLKRGALAAAH